MIIINKRIRVNGVLYEAVSPRRSRSRRSRRLVESYGRPVSRRMRDELEAEPMYGGTEPREESFEIRGTDFDGRVTVVVMGQDVGTGITANEISVILDGINNFGEFTYYEDDDNGSDRIYINKFNSLCKDLDRFSGGSVVDLLTKHGFEGDLD